MINGRKNKMKVYLGEDGLKKSFQAEFPKTTKCHQCNGEARIMFVAIEESQEEYHWICDLHENKDKGNYWVHDAISCAVYLCKDCFETTSILNQA